MKPFAAVLLLCLCGAPARAAELILFAGGAQGGDGVPATQAKLNQPFGIDFDDSGNAYVVELKGERLLRIDADGTFHILGGNGKTGNTGDGGPAQQALFNGMHSLAIGPDKQVYLADTWNNRVRRYEPATGMITAFAGKGEKKYAGDGGPAKEALFSGVFCIAFAPGGQTMYVTDLDNRRIRAIDLTTGRVTLVAGNGERGVPKDGSAAKTSPLVDPRACAADRKGNVYILERGGHALRVVRPDGTIHTLAGTGKPGLSGDGGDAKLAMLNGPKHLCIDLHDDVLIADTANHVIRKYTPADGQITRIAGTGQKGDSGQGGDPLQITFNEPHGVHIRPDGSFYIVDSMNHRIFRWVE
jgi:sugar lactone lactonase YvrE